MRLTLLTGAGAAVGLVGSGKSTGVSYAASATISRSRIEADLGALGRISVVRVPTGGTVLFADAAGIVFAGSQSQLLFFCSSVCQ